MAFVCSFPPRKCGIATFSSHLIRSIAESAGGKIEPLVVAVRSDADRYSDPVKFEIRYGVKKDYICAADYINFSHVDLVCVQHEFGIFGGEAGDYLTLLLNRVNAPVVTTLHTVLDEPSTAMRKNLIDVCNASHKVITMNELGIDMLQNIYGVPAEKIALIPHGIPDLPFVDSNYYKHKFGMENRRTILTFGLLSNNKGIEVMLKAMPEIVRAEPSALYIVLGMTHPSVLKKDGELYRYSLQRMVNELGCAENVIFHNRFVSDEELANFLCAADVYVTPYLKREQLTSGTLSFAVGAGKAVVSTPYWAATELLADGRGKLVDFGDAGQMTKEIIEILKNHKLFYSLRRRAYEYGRSRTWCKIGQVYWKMFNSITLPVPLTSRTAAVETEEFSSLELPELSINHLSKLTDSTGIYQHAKYTVPNRRYGYCTDDNARALIVMSKYYSQRPGVEALRLFDTFLSFVMHAQNDDGTVCNFLNFDRTWSKQEPASDAFGRVLWAYGEVMAEPPSPAYLPIIKDCFDNCIGQIREQPPRGLAYSIVGMSDYLKQFPGASDIKRELKLAADKLVELYNQNQKHHWQWFEDILTYDNAVMPHALFVAGQVFENSHYVRTAQAACRFLLDNTLDKNHFSFVGCNGWYPYNGKKARFDQQPIEAVSTVLMLTAAYEATGDAHYLKLQRKAFDWFLGDNDLQIPLYDFRSTGCCDGLMAAGVNINQGAESTLSFLESLLAVLESYSILDRIVKESAQSRQAAGIGRAPKNQIYKKASPSIEGISGKNFEGKNHVQEIEG